MSCKKYLLFFILVIMAGQILSCGCTGGFPGIKTDRYPSIDENSVTNEYITVSHSFNFENKEITITTPVDKGIYDAAYNSDKSAYVNQDKLSSNNWSSDYYKSFINSAALTPLYDSILAQLRDIKTQMSLDSDRYAELIFAYVQSIPYKTDDIRTEPKFPVETLYENSGDCDDKSLLAAALLSAEGYDVSLLEFESEEHMALGIKSLDYPYKNTGYAYVEITDYNYPGWPVIEINNGNTITSDPFIIPVGDGKSSYNSCDDVFYIYERMVGSEENAENLEPQITIKKSELEELSGEIKAMSERMEGLKRGGDITGYNSLVSDYNSLISEYNKKSSSLEALVDRYNNYVEIYNYIIKHRYDRKGVYEYLAYT